MKKNDVKKLILSSLSEDSDGNENQGKLEEAGVDYSFSDEFTGKIIDRIYGAGVVINREVEFLRSWNLAFYRIALTGVAAILLLIISLYLSEGSISFNTLLGLGDSADESIVYLLTGN